MHTGTTILITLYDSAVSFRPVTFLGASLN